jgi:hypothetical protein
MMLAHVIRHVLGARDAVRRSVRKLDLDHALAQVAHDIECGTHSGIPPCCIAWFMLVRVHQDPGGSEWLAYERLLGRAMRGRKRHVGYAPCPACIAARRFVRVRLCRCEFADDRSLGGVSARAYAFRRGRGKRP